MKNILEALKKAFIGIPLAIFLYELFNLAISIALKQYVRIDGGKLEEVITIYIESIIQGYGLAFLMYYTDILKKESDKKNVIQMTKSVINAFGIVMILTILIMSIIDNDIIFGFIIIAMISLLLLLLLFIIFLFDKKEVNNINKKIKEDNKK